MRHQTRYSRNRKKALKPATHLPVEDMRIAGAEISTPRQFLEVLEATAKLGRKVLKEKKIKRHADQSKTIRMMCHLHHVFGLEYKALNNYVLDRQIKSTSTFLEKPPLKPGMATAKYHFVSYGHHLAKMRPICPDLSDQLYAVMEEVTVSPGFGLWSAENSGREVTLFNH